MRQHDRQHNDWERDGDRSPRPNSTGSGMWASFYACRALLLGKRVDESLRRLLEIAAQLLQVNQFVWPGKHAATSHRRTRERRSSGGGAVRRCLVTGAAGFIGSHLSERLLAEGHTVRGIDALTDYYDREQKLANLKDCRRNDHFEWVEADLNTVTMARLLDGVNTIVHLAGQPGVRGSWGTSFAPYVRNNIDATQRLLEAVRTAPIERFVYASSSSVYGRTLTPMSEDAATRPYSPYGVTKLAGELLCLLYARNFGLPACAVRYFTVFGPRQRPDMAFARFLTSMRDDVGIRVFGDGTQTRDFTYVADAVEGTYLAALRGAPGEVYNLGGGCRVSLNNAIAVLERACGRRARIVHEPVEDGDVVSTLADTTKARSKLEYRPRVDLERGLWCHAESYGLVRTRARPTAADSAPPRLLLYSHDTFGLGHLRRNLAIAEHLLRRKHPYDVLLMSGSPVLATWPKPLGLQVAALPPVVKVGSEDYKPHDEALTFEELKAQRERVIQNAIESFKPDVFLVDHAPAGMRGELLDALGYLRRELPATRTVVGLRDVIDSAKAVRTAWREQGIYDLLEWAYDRILVYGSRELFNIEREYAFEPRLCEKLRYCGYIVRVSGKLPQRSGEFTVVVTTGGGGDGFALVRDYLRASAQLPTGAVRSIIVLGPLMDASECRTLQLSAADRRDLSVLPYTPELLGVLRMADLVVAMGGYNTSAEIVANRIPAVLVPRTTPRVEQLVRARILAGLDLVWLVQSSDDVAGELEAHLRAALAGARPRGLADYPFDVDGARRVGEQLDTILASEPMARAVAS